MSTETSTLATSNVENKRLHAGDQTISGSITGVLTASAGLIYRLCHLPKGAKVSDVTIGGGIGVTTTDVGVTEDDNIFIAAVSASPAAISRIDVVGGVGYTTTTDTYLIVTTDAVSAASTGGTMRFSITYHVD